MGCLWKATISSIPNIAEYPAYGFDHFARAHWLLAGMSLELCSLDSFFFVCFMPARVGLVFLLVLRFASHRYWADFNGVHLVMGDLVKW